MTTRTLEDRLTILEALVARLIQEQRVWTISDPIRSKDATMPAGPLTTWEQLDPPPPATLPKAPAMPPPHTLPQETLAPHPDWLPVLHANGPAACGRPALYLTQRVSGVHKAGPDFVRILPRSRDPATGIWISEPYRAPISSDLVVCQSCAAPLSIWTSQDLDYRPHLDNEIGQPMHPRAARSSPTATDDERLAQLKEQASQLRAQVHAP